MMVAWNKGLTKDTHPSLRQRSIVYKKKFKDKSKHPMYNRKLTPSWKHNVGSRTRGKTYEELYGVEKANQIKQKQSAKRILEKNAFYGKTGAKHPAWRGGVSFDPYTPDFNYNFKRIIKERDNWTCQLCNMFKEDVYALKRRLVVHHINYDKTLSIQENCITLCNLCHNYTLYNRSKWVIFFQSILKEKYDYNFNQEQKVILNFEG